MAKSEATWGQALGRSALAFAALLSSGGLFGCDYAIRLSGEPAGPPRLAGTAKPTGSAEQVATSDPLAGPPKLAERKAFEPEAPVVFQTKEGLTVWLVERKTLPLVSAAFVFPHGASSDPPGKSGLMHLVSDMVDEGAGTRSSLQLSDAVQALGSSLGVSTSADATVAEVGSVRDKFADSFALLCDVVARPKLADADFRRVKKQWRDRLQKRQDDPTAIAMVVSQRVLFPPGAPYAHPIAGTWADSASVSADDVRRAYQATYRPELGTLIVVGQISRPEVEQLVEQNLKGFRAQGKAWPQPKEVAPLSKRPRVVLIERPAAVQTVILAVRDGIAASDARMPQLELINTALGGSFTSRLNLNLREEKGWTYGIGSRFTQLRSPGWFLIRTEVDAKHTGASVKEVLSELGKIQQGLSAEELSKVKALDQSELMSSYEAGASVADRLAELRSLALPSTFDASATRLRQSASLDELSRLAKEQFDPAAFTLILVGDGQLVRAQLAEQGLTEILTVDAEGQPVESGKAQR